jgi:hypothetical protein
MTQISYLIYGIRSANQIVLFEFKKKNYNFFLTVNVLFTMMNTRCQSMMTVLKIKC